MNRLPAPGPGRPHHPSYSEPGPTMSLFELVIFMLAIAEAYIAASGKFFDAVALLWESGADEDEIRSQFDQALENVADA